MALDPTRLAGGLITHQCRDRCHGDTHAELVAAPYQLLDLRDLDRQAHAAGVILAVVQPCRNERGLARTLIVWCGHAFDRARADAAAEVARILDSDGWAEAVHAACELGLITDTDLLGAYYGGHDVLERLELGR